MIAVLEKNCPLRHKADVVRLIESEGLRVLVSETPDASLISVVGEGLGRGISAKVFEIVRGQDVPVEMISYGATRMNLSFLTTQERSKDAVRALHQALFR